MDTTLLLYIFKGLAILLVVIVLLLFFKVGFETKELLTFNKTILTGICGFIANFFDTFGVGSFATLIASSKFFKIMPEEIKLIGTLNLQAMITALVQSIIFLHYVNVSLFALIGSCIVISLGGFLSGYVATHINRKLVHLIMLILFIISGLILLLSQLGAFHIYGMANNDLTGTKLIFFLIFMFIAGFLPAFGVGYYSLIQIIVFLFNANPIIAFPIMATASAFQMPITSIPFLKTRNFYFKSTLLIMIFGTLGVLVAAPLITLSNDYYLKWVLFIIIVYNIFMLSKKYLYNA